MKFATLKLVLIGLPLLTATMAAATPAMATTIVLSDPEQMDCVLKKDPAFYQCNIHYEQELIYEGPDRVPAEAEAGADCLICKNVKAAARNQGTEILMDRRLSWDDENFLTLGGARFVEPISRPPVEGF